MHACFEDCFCLLHPDPFGVVALALVSILYTNKKWVWVGMGTREDAWCGQDGYAYRMDLQGGKTGKLEGGGIWVGLMRVAKFMVLDWGQSEMVVNSYV